jgi:glycosyltransferase involved in cell wall biosynthesis
MNDQPSVANGRDENRRLAIIATHPIQHFVPQYASVAQIDGLEMKVFFESDRGLVAQYDPGFDRLIAWEGLDLGGFEHVFLRSEGSLSDTTLSSELARFNPDALLVYGHMTGIARQGARWARQKQKILVYCADSELRQQRNPVRSVLVHAVKRRLLKRPQVFMTVGDANEAYFRHFGVSSSKFIRTFFPIDVTRYRMANEKRPELRSTTRASMDIGDDDIVLLVVGKLATHKRQSDVIDAVALLNQASGRRYVACFAGSGPEQEVLEARATTLPDWSVKLLGFVPHTDLPSLYLAADIYVHPSEKEPHSLAISEAIFLGLPAIISDKCGSWGPTDDVQVGENGLVFPVGDVQELARCVRSVAEGDCTLARYGAVSRATGAAHQRRAHVEAWAELLARFER